MFFIGLVIIFVLVVILIFAYQKIYNPGKLCRVCYRVVPEMVFVEEIDEEDGMLDYYAKCPFCDSELERG
jgi:hypothetical protein